MMPIPPSWAMVIARRDSVTVSMAAETTGRLTLISRVSWLARETSRGRTSEYAGTSSTSSNVSASSRMRMGVHLSSQEAAHCTLHLQRGKPLSFRRGTHPRIGRASRARRLQRFAPESRGAHTPGTRVRHDLAGGGDLQSVAAELRTLVFLAQGRRRPGALCHVPPAKYVVSIQRPGR